MKPSDEFMLKTYGYKRFNKQALGAAIRTGTASPYVWLKFGGNELKIMGLTDCRNYTTCETTIQYK